MTALVLLRFLWSLHRQGPQNQPAASDTDGVGSSTRSPGLRVVTPPFIEAARASEGNAGRRPSPNTPQAQPLLPRGSDSAGSRPWSPSSAHEPSGSALAAPRGLREGTCGTGQGVPLAQRPGPQTQEAPGAEHAGAPRTHAHTQTLSGHVPLQQTRPG